MDMIMSEELNDGLKGGISLESALESVSANAKKFRKRQELKL